MGPYQRTCALEHFGEQHTFVHRRTLRIPQLERGPRHRLQFGEGQRKRLRDIAANRDGGRPGLCQKRRCCGKQRQEDRNELRVSLMQTA